MKRVVPTAAAAAAAAFALLSSAGVRPARGQLVYEPFDYPAGSSLEAKTNPGNAQPWATMSNNAADDEILLTGGNVTYPGLAAAVGNSVSYAGTGKSERLGLDTTARSGTMFYSLVLRVETVSSMTTSPSIIAGFSDRAGESSLPPTTIGTRLYLRQGATSTPGAETFNVGVSKNSGFDITFDATEYPVNTPLLVVGSYAIVGSGSGTDDLSTLYINPTSLGSADAPTTSTPSSPIITAPVAGTDLTISGVPSLAGFVLRQGTGVPGVQVDELRIDNAWARVTQPTGISWNSSGGGAWSEAAKWSGGASPNSPDAFVNFDHVINAPATVEVDQPVALRGITFQSAQPYTLGPGGGAGSLAFSASAGINVRSGNHAIAAPITLDGEMLISVATAATLDLTGDFDGGSNRVIKAGDGALSMKHLRAGAADIVAGTIAIAPSGGAAGTSRLTSLAVAPEASLDLADNDLVVDYDAGGDSAIGTADGSSYSGLSGLIASGRNGGAWDGGGIRTSRPDAMMDLTTLGIGEASELLGLGEGQTTPWSGQVVDDTSVLVRYTYAGDANLDGLISGDDYSAIDFNIQIPGASGYANGDFNYDGIVSGDDYSMIDFNIVAQGAPLGDAAGGQMSVQAVPEPAGIAIASMTIAGGLRRRRRSISSD